MSANPGLDIILRSPPGWVLRGAKVDLNFANGSYYGGSLASLLALTRASTKYVTTLAGLLVPVATGVLAISDQGLLIEETRTNVALWNRDLTNAAWTPVNITTAKDQTGADGGANSASSITATAGNGTILQVITLGSSARFQTAYVKRITGSGVVNMTMDAGLTWTAIIVTSVWTRVSIPTQTLANPTVGFQIVTSGDAIAVDFVQNENGAFATSPIPTTTVSVARAQDIIQFTGLANALLQGSVGSAFIETGMSEATTFVTMSLISANSSSFVHIRPATATTVAFRAMSNTQAIIGGAGNWTTSPLIKTGVSWDVAGANSAVANNGTVVNGVQPFTVSAINWLGSRQGTATDVVNIPIRRVALWSSRLSDTTLKALTAP